MGDPRRSFALLAAAIVFGLAGCGGGGDEVSELERVGPPQPECHVRPELCA